MKIGGEVFCDEVMEGEGVKVSGKTLSDEVVKCVRDEKR